MCGGVYAVPKTSWPTLFVSVQSHTHTHTVGFPGIECEMKEKKTYLSSHEWQRAKQEAEPAVAVPQQHEERRKVENKKFYKLFSRFLLFPPEHCFSLSVLAWAHFSILFTLLAKVVVVGFFFHHICRIYSFFSHSSDAFFLIFHILLKPHTHTHTNTKK
jgi:hypothetical protein